MIHACTPVHRELQRVICHTWCTHAAGASARTYTWWHVTGKLSCALQLATVQLHTRLVFQLLTTSAQSYLAAVSRAYGVGVVGTPTRLSFAVSIRVSLQRLSRFAYRTVGGAHAQRVRLPCVLGRDIRVSLLCRTPYSAAALSQTWKHICAFSNKNS
jgi:hypothetical protein